MKLTKYLLIALTTTQLFAMDESFQDRNTPDPKVAELARVHMEYHKTPIGLISIAALPSPFSVEVGFETEKTTATVRVTFDPTQTWNRRNQEYLFNDNLSSFFGEKLKGDFFKYLTKEEQRVYTLFDNYKIEEKKTRSAQKYLTSTPLTAENLLNLDLIQGRAAYLKLTNIINNSSRELFPEERKEEMTETDAPKSLQFIHACNYTLAKESLMPREKYREKHGIVTFTYTVQEG